MGRTAWVIYLKWKTTQAENLPTHQGTFSEQKRTGLVLGYQTHNLMQPAQPDDMSVFILSFKNEPEANRLSNLNFDLKVRFLLSSIEDSPGRQETLFAYIMFVLYMEVSPEYWTEEAGIPGSNPGASTRGEPKLIVYHKNRKKPNSDSRKELHCLLS